MYLIKTAKSSMHCLSQLYNPFQQFQNENGQHITNAYISTLNHHSLRLQNNNLWLILAVLRSYDPSRYTSLFGISIDISSLMMSKRRSLICIKSVKSVYMRKKLKEGFKNREKRREIDFYPGRCRKLVDLGLN